MAYSDSFPAIRPSFQFSADAGRLDPRISYSRSTTGSFYGKDKHLSSENLFAYSSPPTGWTLDSFTLTSGQTAPDGSTNAVKLTEDTSGSEHRIYPYSSVTTSGGATTLSGYFKYIGRQWVMFRLNDGTTYRRVWFDIQNGALGSAETGITHSITASGNGYYKCVATIATSNTSYLPTIGGAPANTGITYTGSGADAFYVWGLQYNNNVGSVLSETSGQIHREYAPTLQTAAINAPRFEFSATDSASAAMGESLGLLVEGQTTNLLPNGATGYNLSNAFSWNKINANVVQNAAIAPTGELEATHFYEDTATATQQRFDVPVTVSAAAHTLSGYFKSAGRDEIIVRVANGGTNYWGKLTFSTETTSDAGNPFSSLSVTSVGNGWYRFTATTPTLTAGSTTIYINLSNGALNYDGDGYSGVLFYGLQFEANSFASSVIATSGGTATRAADSASAVTSDIGYTGGPVSIVAEGEGGRGSYPRLFSMGDSSSYLTFFRFSADASTSTDYRFWVYDSGVKQADQIGEASVTKVAVSVDTNSIKSCGDGGVVRSDTAAVTPVLSTLRIGDQPTGGKHWNGHIKRLALYGEALSDSNLQSLTK